MELNYIITYRIICNSLIKLFTSFNSVLYSLLISMKSLSIALYIIIDLFFKLSPLISEIFSLDVIFAYVLLLLFLLSILFIFIFNLSIVSLSLILIIVLVLFSKTCLIVSSKIPLYNP